MAIDISTWLLNMQKPVSRTFWYVSRRLITAGRSLTEPAAHDLVSQYVVVESKRHGETMACAERAKVLSNSIMTRLANAGCTATARLSCSLQRTIRTRNDFSTSPTVRITSKTVSTNTSFTAISKPSIRNRKGTKAAANYKLTIAPGAIRNNPFAVD